MFNENTKPEAPCLNSAMQNSHPKDTKYQLGRGIYRARWTTISRFIYLAGQV